MLARKYNMHLEEIKHSRNVGFFILNFFVIFWGAYIAFLLYYFHYFIEHDLVLFVTRLFVFVVLTIIFYYQSREISIEKIHWEILNSFEDSLPKSQKYKSYKLTPGFHNYNIVLFFSFLCPILSLGVPFIIFGESSYKCWELTIEIPILILSFYYLILTFYYKAVLNDSSK